MQFADQRPQHAPSPGVTCVASDACVAEIRFTAVTFNTLTMRDSKGSGCQVAVPAGMQVVGRKAVIKHQLEKLCPFLVGFSRDP